MLFIRNSCLKNKQLINSTIVRSLNDSEKRVHRVWPEIADTWMLHQNNAPCNTAISLKECLTKKGIPVILQTPYSPDLSPYVFFLFPKLKFHLKGRHWNCGRHPKCRERPAEDTPTWRIPALIQEGEQLLRRFVGSQGKNFEGDNVYL